MCLHFRDGRHRIADARGRPDRAARSSIGRDAVFVPPSFARRVAAIAMFGASIAAAQGADAASASNRSPNARQTQAISATAKTAPLAIPPLRWTDRTLANGLRVIAIEDHASPTVSVQVWYRVGAKDDPPNRSGFAHLFEHMMFKSTRYLKNEQIDRLTEDVGGMNNAGTAADFTDYVSAVPSNHLERMLWAEAERMGNLDVNAANFESERAVVQEEFRQRVLADPYGRLGLAIIAKSYRMHPYRRPEIGSIEDLQAATLNDVASFHRTYYRPDNAVLIIAGDIDAKPLNAWVDRYFGAIARPGTPIPRVTTVEPPWPDDRRVVETAPNVPLPAIAVAWLGPRAADADAPALQIVEALLSAGESARLKQALVHRGQVAAQAEFSFDQRADAGLLNATIVAAQGRSIDDALKQLDAELARLANEAVSDAELDKVKTLLLTHALIERQTPLGLGAALGRATVLEGDPRRANAELNELQAVGADDVRRVVRKYLIDAHRTVVEYGGAPASQAKETTR